MSLLIDNNLICQFTSSQLKGLTTKFQQITWKNLVRFCLC